MVAISANIISAFYIYIARSTLSMSSRLSDVFHHWRQIVGENDISDASTDSNNSNEYTYRCSTCGGIFPDEIDGAWCCEECESLYCDNCADMRYDDLHRIFCNNGECGTSINSFYLCRYCEYIHLDGEVDCNNCGREMCVYLYQDWHISGALHQLRQQWN